MFLFIAFLRYLYYFDWVFRIVLCLCWCFFELLGVFFGVWGVWRGPQCNLLPGVCSVGWFRGRPGDKQKTQKTTKNGTPSPETPSRPSPSWACSEGLPDRSFRRGEGGEDGVLRGPVPGGGSPVSVPGGCAPWVRRLHCPPPSGAFF